VCPSAGNHVDVPGEELAANQFSINLCGCDPARRGSGSSAGSTSRHTAWSNWKLLWRDCSSLSSFRILAMMAPACWTLPEWPKNYEDVSRDPSMFPIPGGEYPETTITMSWPGAAATQHKLEKVRIAGQRLAWRGANIFAAAGPPLASPLGMPATPPGRRAATLGPQMTSPPQEPEPARRRPPRTRPAAPPSRVLGELGLRAPRCPRSRPGRPGRRRQGSAAADELPDNQCADTPKAARTAA